MSSPDRTPAPPYAARIVVSGLGPGAQEKLQQHLRDRGYTDVTVSAEGANVVLTFQTDKQLALVERDLAKLVDPTLQSTRRGFVLEYRAAESAE